MVCRRSSRTLIISVFLSEFTIAQVKIDPPALDFESVKRGAVITESFQVINSSESEIAIKLIEFTIPGLIVKSPKSIEPNSSKEITIELNTSSFSGEINGQINLHTKDKNNPILKIEIKGNVESQFKFEPREAIFLSAFRWEADKKEGYINIKSKEDKPFNIEKVKTESDLFTAGYYEVVKGKDYKIIVKLNPKSEAGMSQNSLTIHTEKEIIKLPVYTFIKEKVYINPPGINFGQIDKAEVTNNRKLLDFLNQSVFVYKHERDDFKDDLKIEFESIPEYLEVNRTPAEGPASVVNIPNQGKTAIFEIIVSPNIDKIKKGKFSDTIRVKTNDKDFPTLEIPVFGEII